MNDFLRGGGVERQFVEQIKFYDRAKFEIILVTLFTFPEGTTLYNELPGDLEVHKMSFTGLYDLKSWLALYWLLRRLKPDIVVSSLFASNFIFRILKPFVGYVSIAREHNTYINKTWLERAIDRALAPLSYRIVAVSKTVADFTAHQERIARDRFFVIYNGIDVVRSLDSLKALPERETLRAKFGFNPKERILLNASRLVPQKNHRLLIEGFMRFHNYHPEYRLIVAGDGPLRRELESQALSSQDSVIFVGHRTDIWAYYKMADAFVAASDIEGLSNAMLEALAAGLPIIATKTAGTDELVKEGVNGFFIEPRDLGGVTHTLEAFDRADTRALSHKASETAHEFDIRETVQAYEDLFIDAFQRI